MSPTSTSTSIPHQRTIGLPTLAQAGLILLLGSPMTVLAQAAPPDAGAIQIQTERGLERQAPPALVPRAAVPQVALPKPGAVVITVRSFSFSGNSLLGAEWLQAAVAPWLMRPLDFAGLQQAAEAVAAAYRDEGWIASASLRRQEIADGRVMIDIVEARFGGVRIEGKPAERVRSERLLAMVDAAQAMGAPLSARAVDRVLLLMDDLPGVSVEGNLVAGVRDGETALALTLADESRFSGDMALDNIGSRSVGIERLSAKLYWASPTGSGDAVGVNLIHTRGSDYQRVSYGLPVGVHGLRLSAQGSNVAYRVISAELAALGARGQAQAASLGLSWPIQRSRLLNLNASLRQEVRLYNNEANGAISSRYRIDVTNAELSGNFFDMLGGGGANSASLSLAAGRVDLSGSPNQAADAQTARSAGHYAKLGLNLTRQQAITATKTGRCSSTDFGSAPNWRSEPHGHQEHALTWQPESFLPSGLVDCRALLAGRARERARPLQVRPRGRRRHCGGDRHAGDQRWQHGVWCRPTADGCARTGGRDPAAQERLGRCRPGRDQRGCQQRRDGSDPDQPARGDQLEQLQPGQRRGFCRNRQARQFKPCLIAVEVRSLLPCER
jgi:hemolysin activation/secretion protein